MINLTFEPLITNADVYLLQSCEGGTVEDEFLPTSPKKVVGWQGRGLYLNEKKKSTKRGEGVAEEDLVRVVDVYPEEVLNFKSRTEIGSSVTLVTEAYGTENGYLESVQFFDGSNLVRLYLCLSKA